MIRTLLFTGDSTTQGTQGGFNMALGGRGCWYELVAERLANVEGVGPLISSGFRGCNLGFTASGYPSEWTVPSSGLTSVLSTDAFDVYPYTAGRYANGASKIWTWTKPARWRSIVGFALYWVDKTSGGNWQYRIDGGTWTNMGQTLNHNNKLCKFYVATAVTTSVDIRASSDASTGVDCFPAGIEVYYQDPLATTQGLIVHCIAVNGSRLNQLCATTSGDRLAFLDSVQLGTGSPLSPTPNAGVLMMHINDVVLASSSGWATDLTTLNSRASPLGPVGFINVFEANTSVYGQVQQTNYRAQTKTTAAGFATPAKVYDIYDAWASNGWTGNAEADAAGMFMDLTHESQAGHIDIASRIYWFVRNQILSLGAVSTGYPATANKTSVTYTGIKSSVVYSAGVPISLD